MCCRKGKQAGAVVRGAPWAPRAAAPTKKPPGGDRIQPPRPPGERVPVHKDPAAVRRPKK